MATAPTASGTYGARNSRTRSAWQSSQSPVRIARTTTPRNTGLTVYSVPRTSAPRPSPTAMATGRFLPARPTGVSVLISVMVVECSDFEQLRFLVPERLVRVLDVLVRELLQLLLRPRHVVLTDLAVARELVELL